MWHARVRIYRHRRGRSAHRHVIIFTLWLEFAPCGSGKRAYHHVICSNTMCSGYSPHTHTHSHTRAHTHTPCVGNTMDAIRLCTVSCALACALVHKATFNAGCCIWIHNTFALFGPDTRLCLCTCVCVAKIDDIFGLDYVGG